MDGGEARQLTRFKYGMHSFVWSPDSKTLFGLVPAPRDGDVEVFAHDVSEKEAKEQSDKALEEWRNGAKHYDWLYYKRDGAGLSRGLATQLVAVDVETGEFRQLTKGIYDVGEPAVSPDGQYVAFPSNRRPDYETAMASDIYRVSVKGGDLELLCDDTRAFQLSYSPDGSQIAFFGHKNEYRSATHVHLYTIPAEGGTATDWLTDFPDSIGNYCISDMRNHEHTPPPIWTKDGKSIYALSTREGKCEIVKFTRNGDTTDARVVVGGDREIYGFSYDGGTKFAISYTTVTHPGKVAVVDTAGEVGQVRTKRNVTDPMTEQATPNFPENEVRLDDCNDDLLSEIIVVEPEPFWYTSEDGWRVHGFVMKPAAFEEGKTYPVILEIHGGPHANYSYSYFHEMQYFAAQGYAIVYTNPRGSASYGQEFVNACRHDYGGRDAADILNGLDAALERFSFLDASRVAVTGGSYGGFMTNWLVGHTDRFFAAVSQRSISNWISFYGVSDIGPFFTEWEIGGDIYNDFEKLWKHSPLAYAKNVKTPLLLKHGENDLRCPIEQAEQFYTAIKRNGGEVELVRIPDASHDLSRNGKPKLRFARLDSIIGFINRHLPGEA
jgi:dipeptidyl aminopeptidase/acylaminoacyl peptidase